MWRASTAERDTSVSGTQEYGLPLLGYTEGILCNDDCWWSVLMIAVHYFFSAFIVYRLAKKKHMP